MIREAKPADAHEIASVHIDSWQVAYRGLISEEILNGLDVKDRADRWVDIINSSKLPCLVIESPTGVAGFAHMSACRDSDLDDTKYGEITAIYMSPNYWRQGLGTKLLLEALSCLKRYGFQFSTLWVLEENMQAREFYAVHQFSPDGQTKYAQRLELSELRYQRRL